MPASDRNTNGRLPGANLHATAREDRSRLASLYDPGRLFDSLRAALRLKNDAALSRALGLGPPVISKIRNRQIPVGASVLIRIHEATDMSIAELRAVMGDQRKRHRFGKHAGSLEA